MSEPLIGEIRLFGFNFAPRGWALCDGQLLPIAQHPSLFSILGTTYGGDGSTSFALPDLRGRVPVHRGAGIALGQQGGSETVTVTLTELATHTHTVNASSALGTTHALSDQVLARSNDGPLYSGTAPVATMSPSAIESTGGGDAHENMQPYLTISYCIALEGSFPPRS